MLSKHAVLYTRPAHSSPDRDLNRLNPNQSQNQKKVETWRGSVLSQDRVQMDPNPRKEQDQCKNMVFGLKTDFIIKYYTVKKETLS